MKTFSTPVWVLWLSCVSLSVTLSASTLSRNTLYIAALISVVELLRKRPTVQWNPALTVILITLLLGVSLTLPAYLHPSLVLHHIDQHYLEAATRMMIGSVIAFYLVLQRDRITRGGWAGACGWIMAGFIYTIVIALQLNGKERLEINTVATMTAYVFAVLSLVALNIALQLCGSWRTLSTMLVIGVSGYILVLTQTRAVLLTWPLLVLIFLWKERFFTSRNISIFLVLLGLSLLLALPKIEQASARVMRSLTEIQSYQRQDQNTSLGARFSMWKAGLYAFSGKSFGESADERDNLARQFIILHDNGNPEALRSIVNHYHNDLIEAATLRGLAGLGLLIGFYGAGMVASRRFTGSSNTALLLIVPTILYGITDTLFIDHRYVTMLVLLLPFYLCLPAPAKTGQRSVGNNDSVAK